MEARVYHVLQKQNIEYKQVRGRILSSTDEEMHQGC